MANNVGSRPWVIDTAGATTVKSGNAYVKSIVFSGYNGPTDTAVIKCADASGNQVVLATLVGNAGLEPVSFNVGAPYWVKDLAVTILDSGQVSVFV